MSFAGCFLHISAVRSQQGPSGSQGQYMVRRVVEGDVVDLAHEIQHHHAIGVIEGYVLSLAVADALRPSTLPIS